jgi:hypothetical protein
MLIGMTVAMRARTSVSGIDKFYAEDVCESRAPLNWPRSKLVRGS